MAGYGAIGANDTDAVLERTLMMKQEVLIYRIPPAQIGDSENGWKATGWNLEKPDWKGKLRLVAKGTHCLIKLEERGSNKEFAHVEVDTYPGPAVMTVTDSSRYFVIKTNNHDYVGLGFGDRSDSFDLNVALQDHFKSLRVEEEIEKERKRALIREIRQLEAERIEDRNYKLPVNYSCIFLLVSNEKKIFPIA